MIMLLMMRRKRPPIMHAEEDFKEK